MNRINKHGARAALWIIAFALACVSFPIPPLTTYAQTTPDPLDILTVQFNAEGFVSVIVGLDTDTGGLVRFSDMTDALRSQVIARQQERVLQLDGLRSARNITRYQHLPALALEVDPQGLEALRNAPDVTYVQVNQWRRAALSATTQRIGARGDGGAWSLGYTGTGQTIAILDTGVDYTHPYLTGKRVAEACYGTNSSFTSDGILFNITSVCPGGATASTAVNSGANCTVNTGGHDECGHGTSVAGTALGKDTIGSYSGVAPDASLISVQVFSRVTSIWCGTSTNQCVLAADDDILKGLDYVYSQRNNFNIAAVNLSLGGGRYYDVASCNADNPAYVAIANQLTAAGIAVIAASGNESYTNSLSAPACVSNIISVGGTGNAGSANSLWNGGNTAAFLDLVAPGYAVTMPAPGNALQTGNGTSFSAPHVAGAYAILRQYRPAASLTEYLQAMQITGRDITGAGRGTFKQPRLQEAIQYLTVPQTPVLVSPASNAPQNTHPITFTWQAGADTDFYRLQIFNASNQRIVNQQVEHNTCGATCSFSLIDPLPDNASYEWRVVARNEYRTSNSARRPFSVDYPGQTTLISPSGSPTFDVPGDISAFVWQAVPSATEYRLMIRDSATNKNVIRVDISGAELASICDESTCTYTLTPEQQDVFVSKKTYRWGVRPSNTFGMSKTMWETFSTRFPPAPELVMPFQGEIISNLSTFEALVWDPSISATAYRIRLVDKQTGERVVNVVLPEEEACSAACVYFIAPHLDSLKNGRRYEWSIQARSPLGKTGSEKRWFEIQTPATPALIAPAGNEIFTTHDGLMFSWSAVEDVDDYRLRVVDRGNHNTVLDTLITGDTCTPDTCTYTPTEAEYLALPFGRNYGWTVQARNSVGRNTSTEERFRMRAPEVTKPALQLPVNGVDLDAPQELVSLQWAESDNATHYRVIIQDVSKNQRVAKVDLLEDAPALSCGGGACVYTVPAIIQDALRDKRNYEWRVIAFNPYGKAGSARFSFRARFPGKPALITPEDDTRLNNAAELVTLAWTPRAHATQYVIRVNDVTRGNRLWNETLPPSDEALTCDESVCVYTVPQALRDALRDGRNYEWLIFAENAQGSYKSGKFTFRARF